MEKKIKKICSSFSKLSNDDKLKAMLFMVENLDEGSAIITHKSNNELFTNYLSSQYTLMKRNYGDNGSLKVEMYYDGSTGNYLVIDFKKECLPNKCELKRKGRNKGNCIPNEDYHLWGVVILKDKADADNLFDEIYKMF